MDSSTLDFLKIPFHLLDKLPWMWTYLLLVMRYTSLLMVLPGIGMGERGMLVRAPAAMMLAMVSMAQTKIAVIPSDIILLAVTAMSELLLGLALGLIPLILVSAAQNAAQLASTSMGFGAAQLIDPTTGGQSADLARITSDITVLVFLMIGGHHLIIQAAAGWGGEIVPGAFRPGEASIEMLIGLCADIFRLGVALSSPVIVALLLTQFVMGLISRAVPTVNIFVISFPLTIGIGLIISILALPEISHFMSHEFTGLDNEIQALANDAGAGRTQASPK